MNTSTPPSFRPALQAAGRTHQGLVRPGNEDSFLCGRWVFAVADGVGGHPAGEVASALVLEPVNELDARDATDEGPTAALLTAAHEGNRRVRADAAAHPARAGMGTTMTAAAVANGTVALAHAGDSRAYLLRPGDGLQRLTLDHTPVEDAVMAGELSREEAETHPHRHVLNRVVGPDPDVAFDTPEPVTLAAGDRLLLCSDGLTEAITEADIRRLLQETPEVQAAVDDLVEAALSGGAPDNVTVVLVGAG
jgi:protein phosphatase